MVNWSDIPAESYNLEVYHGNANGDDNCNINADRELCYNNLNEREFWVSGLATVSEEQTTIIVLRQSEPYAYDFRVKQSDTDITGGTVGKDTNVTYEVSVRNSSVVHRTVRIGLWVDRNTVEPCDFFSTSPEKIISKNAQSYYRGWSDIRSQLFDKLYLFS